MTILYKLTDIDGYTRLNYSNRCFWGPGISHSGTGKGDLCGPGWIHAYTDPLLAVLMNPIHGAYDPARMWEARGIIEKRDGQLKVGCRTLTIIRELSLPDITLEASVRFAILCAKEVCHDPEWNKWADDWLNNKNRRAAASEAAAAAAAAAEAAAASWAEAAAPRSASWAVRAAAAAEEAAASWAEAAAARSASWAVRAADTAAEAAEAAEAASGAVRAAKYNQSFNLTEIAHKAINP